MPANINCTRCPLHLGTKSVCVWGEGNITPGGVMLLGEAPGAEEEAARRPFIGSAGKELDSLLRLSGHSRSEVYIANATKCRPPGNRTPLVTESAACFSYLAEELQTVQPRVILCLGGSALKSLTGKDSIAANRGRPVAAKPTVRIGEAQIYVTYHPAAIMHNRNPQEMARIREAIVQDIQLAFSMANGSRSVMKGHKRALLPEGHSARDLKRGIDGLMDCKVLACDLEWTALRDRGMSWPWTRGAELYTISLSGRVGDTIRSLAFSWPPAAEAEEDVKLLFECKPMVFHNALADLNWLESVGLHVKLGGDTLILAHLMDEEQRLALDQLAPLYTDTEPGWKIPPRDTRPSTKEEWLTLLEYNANDTCATLKLAEALHARLEQLTPQERDGIKRIYYKLLLPVISTMVDMAMVGIPMEPEGLDRELAISVDRAKGIAGQIAELVGCNPSQAAALAGSPMQTLHFLNDRYNLEIDSSRKDDLVGYGELYPIIGLIQKYRWERNKVQGTYLGPWQELLQEQGDGRLHSVYRLTYARTGRTSAEIEKGGSLQLMPREQEGRELKVRHLVRAQEGKLIVAADYSQIEIRIMAWFANEKVMLQLYKDGEDLHAATAAFIMNQPMPLAEFWPRRKELMARVTKDQRQGAKGVNFGLLYKQEVDGLITYCKNTYGVEMTWEQGELAHSSFFKLYPDVRAYHEYCERVIFPRGYTETPFGRRRRNLEDARKAVNTPIQATASDLTLYAMHNIAQRFKRELPGEHVIGFVHDSVLCEVSESVVDMAERIIKEEMEHPDLRPLGVRDLPVPLKADVLIGPTWGDAS